MNHSSLSHLDNQMAFFAIAISEFVGNSVHTTLISMEPIPTEDIEYEEVYPQSPYPQIPANPIPHTTYSII